MIIEKNNKFSFYTLQYEETLGKKHEFNFR